MAYLCGDGGYVKVDAATNLEVLNWNGSETAELSETTNTGSDGYKESLVCKKVMTGSFEANYDATLGPKSDPDIDAGDTVALELHTGASGNYSIATAIITSLNWTMPAGGAITWSCDFESSGAYSHA